MLTVMTEDIDFSDLERTYAVPPVSESYDNVIIIDHLPRVDEKKAEKLMAILKKSIFAGNGSVVPDGAFMPRNKEDGMTKGYLFAEFETAEQAEAVLKAAHGYRLDKQHVLYAFRFTDFERLANLEDEFREPELPPFVEHEYLRSWLLDPQSRDQFVTINGPTVSVSWTSRYGQPEVAESRSHWTDRFVQWSARGSYLATVHGQGVALWGGPSWQKIARYPHQGVKLLDFSPCEAFLITWSPHDPHRTAEPNLLVWDIVAQKLAKGFIHDEPMEPETWPALKWSFDDRYFVRVQPDVLAIYETQTFAVLDKKPMAVAGIRDVLWSSCGHQLAYWCPETQNVPARVAILEVPSRQTVRTKNLFNVSSCQLFWHAEGRYFAVVVDRHGKNKSVVFSNIELFRMQEKAIPVDVLEFDIKVEDFAWEPAGHRFAASRKPDVLKTLVGIYTMDAVENGLSTVRLVGDVLERKSAGKLLWCPRGDFLLLASVGSTGAALEFFHVGEMSTIVTRDHYMATDVEWDPSGTYVVSYVTFAKHQLDNGFIIWDAKGDQVSKVNLAKFVSFQWRPRPPTMLDAAAIKGIRKNLKAMSQKFEAQDAQHAVATSGEEAAVRERLLREWQEWRASLPNAGEDKLKAEEADDNLAEVEEWIEEIVDETEEVVPDE